jgi:hypothetical protein
MRTKVDESTRDEECSCSVCPEVNARGRTLADTPTTRQEHSTLSDTCSDTSSSRMDSTGSNRHSG